MGLAVAELIRGEPLLAAAYEAARRRIDDAAELAFDKLVAHLDDPKKHPMPAKAHCMERALLRLIAKAPDRDRRKIVRDHKARLTPTSRRKRYGVLADVDLTRAVPVVEQVKAALGKEIEKAPAAERKRIAEKLAAFRPAPATPERPRRAAPKAGARAPATGTRPTPRGGLPNRIELVVEKVDCREKTIEMFEGADEMRLAVNGFTIDDLIRGTPRSTEFVDLGQFKKGDSRTLNATTISLPLVAGELPADFIAIFAAAEKDRFTRDDDELDDVVALVLLAFVAAGEAVMIFGVLLGLIIGLAMTTIWWLAMAAGILIGLGFSAAMVVRRRLGDDVFEFARVQVQVASAADEFPSETTTLRNSLSEIGRKRGEYGLTYRWQLA